MSEEQQEEIQEEQQTATEPVKARLKTYYHEEVVPELMDEHDLDNKMAAPKLDKIVINIGLGEDGKDSSMMDEAQRVLRVITGQQPVVTRARKDIAAFNIRTGLPIGCKVTLRRERAYEFLDRLVSIALPRIRDFRGLSPTSFDGGGNYSLGLQEQVVFPEVDVDEYENTFGMDITVCTTAEDDELARGLLTKLGMPFRQE